MRKHVTKAERLRVEEQIKSNRQVCTCLGFCKGTEGLGDGWVCALELKPLRGDTEEHYRDKTAPERESRAEGLGPKSKIRKYEEER